MELQRLYVYDYVAADVQNTIEQSRKLKNVMKLQRLDVYDRKH